MAERGGILKALLIGVGIGAVASLLARVEINITNDEGDDPAEPEVPGSPSTAPFMSEELEAAANAGDGSSVDDDHVDDTPQPSESATLIDSLVGIKEPGQGAVLVKCRVLGIERAKVVAMHGSKGVIGDEPTVFQRFKDLSTDHLVNIREHSTKVSDDEKLIVESILEDRVAEGSAPDSVLF